VARPDKHNAADKVKQSKVTGVARYRFLLHATEGTLSRSCKVFPGPIWHFATCVEPINFAIRIRREILLVGGILGTRKRRPEEVLELKSFEKHKNGDCEPAHDVTSVARPFIMWLGNLGPQVLTGLSTTFSAFSLLPTLPFNTNDPGAGKGDKGSEYVQYRHRDKRRKAPTRVSDSRVSER
jgi:hypothetical protein